MGGHDDNGNKKSYESDSSTWDFGVVETQIFDCQISDSPTSSSGNKFNSGIPFNDTVAFDDELATQVMEPDGETELLNLYDDTQVVNFDDEIEVMDIPDSAEENKTQLFNDFDTEEVAVYDHEESEKTEVVEDSDDDSGKEECANSADIGHTQILHHCNEDIKKNISKTDCEQHTSGVGFKTFICNRAASMRAAGLAAQNKASQKSKSPSSPNLSSEPDIEHRRILFEKSQSENDNRIDGSETVRRCIFGRSTARKLFADDETEDVNDDITPRGADKSAGLSYIDSQEPGDASHANALDFVDNFLKVNIECDNEFDFSKSTGGKSKPVLSAKGTQSFAKSACLINAVNEIRVFDWDDNLEEGDFFRKNKEAFFASGGRRVKSSISSEKSRKLCQSDSKLVLCKNKNNNNPKKCLGTRIKDVSLRKNLMDELGKQSTDMPAGIDIQEKIQETTDVHFDTQMAAESMEDLCFGLQNTDHDSTNYKSKGSHKSKKPPLSNNVVRKTRSNSKSKTNVDQSNKVKSAVQAYTKKMVSNDIENLDNISSDVAKRQGKVSLKRKEITSVDQMLVKKQCIQNVTPVARRTRQSIKDTNFDKFKDASTSTDHILSGFYPKRKKLSSLKQPDAKSATRLTRSNTGSLTRIDPTTPLTRGTPIKESSPICIGDEYFKQSCIRSSLIQQLMSSSATRTPVTSPNKDSRKRKDVSSIRVLFSRHLDGDIIKHQKKILYRLGASESSSMTDATHFIADEFVRTRNMLEAVAFGKPVVTHLWLEKCGQASCHIDEKDFILKDAKKEKEFGFSLPNSLARACQNPLLKGQKVLITPNTKPGKEILSSLVKAVHGVAVERMGRSGLKNGKVREGLLILSCEEDYAVCLPFLEKGAAIYSSELLLNGIVTQRLEYERHQLFADHVKRTRSTIWLKKDDKYKPVGKVKLMLFDHMVTLYWLLFLDFSM